MKQILLAKALMMAVMIAIANAQPAQAAYIDPSTGGQLFQLLAVVFAFFSGMMLFLSSYIKMGFARFKRFLRGTPAPQEEETV